MYSLMSMRIIARSSSNKNSASARASSVLPTPVGPRNRNEPIGPLLVAEPRARAAHRVGDGRRARRPARPRAGAGSPPCARSFCISPSSILRHGNAGPLARRSPAMSSSVTSSLQVRCPSPAPRASSARSSSISFSSVRDLAVLNLGGLAEVARALRACSSSTRSSSSCGLLLANLVDELLLAQPLRAHRVALLVELGDLALELVEARLARLVALPLQRLLLDLKLHAAAARPGRSRPACCRSPS